MDHVDRSRAAPRTIRLWRAGVAAGAALLAAFPAEAHGGATGAQEFFQHNLVTIAFLVVIVVAASALVWVNRPGSKGAPPSLENVPDPPKET